MWPILFQMPTLLILSVLGMIHDVRADSQNILESILQTGKVYLSEQKYSEARLGATEAEELARAQSFANADLVRIAILKAESLIGLHQLQEAEQVISMTGSMAGKLHDVSIRNDLLQVKLKLKTIQCSLLGNPEKWAPLWRTHPRSSTQEGQLIEQLKRRATCLEESVLTFKNILNLNLEAGNSGTQDASQIIAGSYAAYQAACLGQIMKKEIFRTELETRLLQDFNHSIRRTQDLIKTWRDEFNSPTKLSQKKSLALLSAFLASQQSLSVQTRHP